MRTRRGVAVQGQRTHDDLDRRRCHWQGVMKRRYPGGRMAAAPQLGCERSARCDPSEGAAPFPRGRSPRVLAARPERSPAPPLGARSAARSAESAGSPP
eukprot:scaffold113620_cov36-Phaeocystis_antarctica.AAC.2